MVLQDQFTAKGPLNDNSGFPQSGFTTVSDGGGFQFGARMNAVRCGVVGQTQGGGVAGVLGQGRGQVRGWARPRRCHRCSRSERRQHQQPFQFNVPPPISTSIPSAGGRHRSPRQKYDRFRRTRNQFVQHRGSGTKSRWSRLRRRHSAKWIRSPRYRRIQHAWWEPATPDSESTEPAKQILAWSAPATVMRSACTASRRLARALSAPPPPASACTGSAKLPVTAFAVPRRRASGAFSSRESSSNPFGTKRFSYAGRTPLGSRRRTGCHDQYR